MAVIIGIVNGITLLDIDKITPFIKFLIALGIGITFGYLGMFGLSIETGLITALASSGLYKIATRIGGV
jgi:hypothetical protein